MRGFAVVALLGMLAPTAPAAASDNDEDPPYMIYIDPATGKYTTRNSAQTEPAAARPAEQARPHAKPVTSSHYGFLITTVLLLSAGIAWKANAGRSARHNQGDSHRNSELR